MTDNNKLGLDIRNAAKAIYGFTDEELEDDMTEPKEVEPAGIVIGLSISNNPRDFEWF